MCRFANDATEYAATAADGKRPNAAAARTRFPTGMYRSKTPWNYSNPFIEYFSSGGLTVNCQGDYPIQCIHFHALVRVPDEHKRDPGHAARQRRRGRRRHRRQVPLPATQLSDGFADAKRRWRVQRSVSITATNPAIKQYDKTGRF